MNAAIKAPTTAPVLAGAEALTLPLAEELDRRLRAASDRVANDLDELLNLIEQAVEYRIWETLGYPSLAAYLFDAVRYAPTDRNDRKKIVALMAQREVTNRSLAALLGVDESTIRADRKEATAGNPAVDEASSTTGIDGRTRRKASQEELEVRRIVRARGWRMSHIGVRDHDGQDIYNLIQQLGPQIPGGSTPRTLAEIRALAESQPIDEELAREEQVRKRVLKDGWKLFRDGASDRMLPPADGPAPGLYNLEHWAGGLYIPHVSLDQILDAIRAREEGELPPADWPGPQFGEQRPELEPDEEELEDEEPEPQKKPPPDPDPVEWPEDEARRLICPHGFQLSWRSIQGRLLYSVSKDGEAIKTDVTLDEVRAFAARYPTSDPEPEESADQLALFGEPDKSTKPTDLYRRVTLKLTPELAARWVEIRKLYPDDSSAFASLLGAVSR
jgi:hypothetical protein